MNVINWHRQKLLLPLFGVVFVYSLNENSNLSIPHLAPCYWTSAFSLYFFCFGLCCWICVPWIVNTWSVTRGSIWIYRHCVNRFFISSGSVWFCFRFWYGFLFFVVFFFPMYTMYVIPAPSPFPAFVQHLHCGNLFTAANNADLLFADCSHHTSAEKRCLE